MSKSLQTILLLAASNSFMTIAWYGHLKFKNVGIITAILISWGIALVEYSLMVPANKIESNINGGPFNINKLKIIPIQTNPKFVKNNQKLNKLYSIKRRFKTIFFT